MEPVIELSFSSKSRLIVLESIIGFGVGFLGGLVGLVLGSVANPCDNNDIKNGTQNCSWNKPSGGFCKWEYLE